MRATRLAPVFNVRRLFRAGLLCRRPGSVPVVKRSVPVIERGVLPVLPGVMFLIFRRGCITFVAGFVLLSMCGEPLRRGSRRPALHVRARGGGQHDAPATHQQGQNYTDI
jgi:hypothetical protein